MSLSRLMAATAMLACVAASGFAQEPARKINADGSVTTPGFVMPFSSYASPEAKAAFVRRHTEANPFQGIDNPSIAQIRKIADEAYILPAIARFNARYAVTMTTETIDGVFVQVFTPKAGVPEKNRHSVLINLHGGGLTTGSRTQSQIESIPIAAVAGVKVISVDYRLGPENVFPAASEDIATVYRHLLKTYKPSEIGIYGCSAGGTLTAGAMPWFLKEKLPLPGAIGVLCTSTGLEYGGDSAWLSGQMGGFMPAPPGVPESQLPPPGDYLKGASYSDPLVFPGRHPEVIAQFPPTLFITGTRAGEMSGVLRSHLDLVKAGVDAELFVWDGLDHGFFADPDLPESWEAYAVIAKFFAKHLRS